MQYGSLVTVIVPIYNAEKYLDKCLTSICNQTFSNLEIILVDDGSTDNSLRICREYANKDKRILVVSKENEGQGKARNIGLDMMQGEYVVFIDSDDYIHLQMIEIMLCVAKKYEADMVQCLYQEIGTDSIDKNTTIIENNKVEVRVESITDERLLCYYTEDILPVNKLFRRDLISNYRYPENMIYEDKHLMFRLRYYAKKIVYVDIPLYYYVQTTNSTMRRNLDSKMLKSQFRLMEELEKFCKQNNLYKNYQSEQSGNFRMLISIFFQTFKRKEYLEYNIKAKQLLKKYIPELKNNPYVLGKDKILLRILSTNINFLIPLYYMNKLRKRI